MERGGGKEESGGGKSREQVRRIGRKNRRKEKLILEKVGNGGIDDSDTWMETGTWSGHGWIFLNA